MKELVIFTDLDGTLISLYDQDFKAALPAIHILKEKRIPIVFCSAKTRAEQEVLRKKLGIKDPFIVENGGAIFIPEDYFPFEIEYSKRVDRYKVIELGLPYEIIREKIEEIRREYKIEFLGFGDLTPEKVSKLTGLDLESSYLAMQREYDETLVLDHLPDQERYVFLDLVKKVGLRWTHGGKFYHVMGKNDKGKAVKILKNLFKRKYKSPIFVGLGDRINDVPMLKEVDVAFLIEKEEGGWEEINIDGVISVKGKGPVGWNNAINMLLFKKGKNI